MPTTAYLSPATPTELTASDDTRVRINNAQSTTGTDFGFALPSGATIDGVEATVEWSVTAGSWTATLNLWDDANLGTAKTQAEIVNTTDAVVNFGGAADLWGSTLTTAIVNSTTFGLNISVVRNSGAGNARFDVDHVQLRITYTEGGSSNTILIKLGGVFVEKPRLVKVGGVFQ